MRSLGIPMIKKKFMAMMNENQYFKIIDGDYVKTLPVKSFPGKIHLVDHPKIFERVKPILLNESILGFDTETKPAFKKGRFHKVALLQLSANDQAFLFRLNKISLPDFIIDVLENESIIKVGVALKDDIAALKKIKLFKPAKFIDLQQLVKHYGIEDNGLKKLVANVLGFRISKRYQTSNWEQEILSPEQLGYAATDAWVCHQIYATLMLQNKSQ
jgi:ribonuclease D